MNRFLMILLLTVSSLSFAQDVKLYIPDNCKNLTKVVLQENQLMMPKFKETWYFGALIEHESCISLKHSKCCSASAKLETPRELGVGVGQITKAYNSDGSIRFDSLQGLKDRYKEELKDLSWGNVRQRVDLQVRAIILMTRSNYNLFPTVHDELEKIRMVDSAYNGGGKAVTNARTACGLAANCDPQIWSGNVERYINKSKKPIYAGRSALDINLHHVKDVTITRRPKYQLLYQ